VFSGPTSAPRFAPSPSMPATHAGATARGPRCAPPVSPLRPQGDSALAGVQPGADAGPQRRFEAFQDTLHLSSRLVVDPALQRSVGRLGDGAAGVAQLGQPLAELVAPRLELRERDL